MPLALLILFAGYLLVNAGIRGVHPWADIIAAFGGSPPGPPGVSPGQPGSISTGPAVTTTEPYGPPSPATEQGPTRSLQRIITIAKKVPGTSFGGLCADPSAGGHISGSEHYDCNAIDIFGSKAVLVAVFAVLHTAAKAGAPIHCIIWNRHIYSRESGFVQRDYSGPSAHTEHVHVSGWPSIGGQC